MSKDIFFISNICYHQVNNLQKSEICTVTTFNLIHKLHWSRKHHTTIAEYRMRKKEMRKICDESKDKLRTPFKQWRLNDNKYMTSWQWFI